MPNEDSLICPLCGNRISPGTDRCPVCATELRKATEKTRKAGPGPRHADDYLRKGLPRTELPSAVVKCPLCAMELGGRESKCPRCGIPLVSQAEMLECPECGSLAPPGSRACPSCGVGFEAEAEEEAAPSSPVEKVRSPVEPERPASEPPPAKEPTPIPEPLPVREPEPPPEVATSITTESPARLEGLVNGRGAMSGAGMVNGTGLVNGTGMTNGARPDMRVSASPRRRKAFLARWQLLAVLVAVVVIVPSFIYLVYMQEPGEVSVDGRFGDWSDVQKFSSYTTSSSSTVNIDEWAVQTDGVILYLYVKVEGAVMWSAEVSCFYLFIDSDGLQSTGYLTGGIGADYLLELDGWDGSVGATALYRYGSTEDQLDWNKWQNIGSAASELTEDRIEASAELPAALGESARYLLVSQDQSARVSASHPVPKSGGVLVIRQEPGAGIQPTGLVPKQSNVAFMRLVLSCDGIGGTIESMEPSVSGASAGPAPGMISLAVGDEKTATVVVDTSSSEAGSVVTASINPSNVVSTFEEVIVLGSSVVRAYVSSPPATIQIDGAFGDWSGRTSVDSDGFPLANPNIDIDEVGAVNESAASFFYVSVLGGICRGTYVPVLAAKPTSGGGGGAVVPIRKSAEDIFRAYIDTDLSSASGYSISVPSKFIGAEYCIEVRGVHGVIVSRSLKSYSSGVWADVAGADVTAANDYSQLEVRVSSSSIAGASAIDFIIETTDWYSRKDLATAAPQGTKAATALGLTMGTRSWIIEGNIDPQATAMSYQRKLFFDGVNFWSFYWDGTNTVHKYSVDGGQTWTLAGAVYKTSGVNEVSIWYDSAGGVVYAVGDRSTASTDVYLQKGTVTAATHQITWQSSDDAVKVSAQNLGGKNAFVSLDASGYVWLLSSNLSSTTPDRFTLTAWRSGAVGSTSSFVFSGEMITGGVNNEPNVKGLVVPAGTGSDVWTVYSSRGSVHARKYTGSWSGQTTIYDNLENAQNQDLAPPSAVVDGRGVIHVVYGNGNEQPVGTCKPEIFYVYNNGPSWSVPFQIDVAGNNQGNFYPTISLDSSTGKAYAFWIQTDNFAVGRTIVGKVNNSGTWTLLTLPGQTTDSKQYLSSIYSASAEGLICWQWTQNTTAPIQLHFDKLPEFDNIVMPVLSVLLLCVVGVRMHRKRRS